MDKRTPLPMTPFDTLTSSGELQMVKLLLPYTPPAIQRMLAFFIKFTELQNTVRYFGVFSRAPVREEFQGSAPSFPEILEELKPYMGESSETVDSILSAMSMMEMMKDMDLSGMSSPDPSASGGGNMEDILNMMHMFQSPPSGGDSREDTEDGNDLNRKEMNDNGAGMDGSSGNETY